MEFRLIYRGPLGSQRGGGRAGSIVEQKHAIRRQLHSQLKELWHTHPSLKYYTGNVMITQPGDTAAKAVSRFNLLAQNFTKFGYRFIPLVSNLWGLACSLEILFLRRDAPGNLVHSGGDIDNRIKVLLDGLRIPQYNNEVEGLPPQDGEDPFFCLLEDDQLITEIKVTTDRLLIPQETQEHVNDVHLVMSVKTKVTDPNKTDYEMSF